MPMPDTTPPERGTGEWLQDLAARVEAIRIDMAWMHPIDGDLTEGERANVCRLGAELAAIAREMTGEPPAEQYAIVRRVKGAVDDVAITCNVFRLEQMARSVWWSAIYRGEKQVSFWFRYDREKGIVVNVQDDDLNCQDDTVGANDDQGQPIDTSQGEC